MNRWGVAELDALAILGHFGGLTKKGTRPRFKLNPDEIDILTRLRDIDLALTTARLDPQEWLREPIAAKPFLGVAPLSYLSQSGLPGARELIHYIFQQGLRWSIADKRTTRLGLSRMRSRRRSPATTLRLLL